MPAVSRAQQRFMGMCEHTPSHARGQCPSKTVAREFASTSHAGLPERKKISQSKRAMRDRSTRGSPPMTHPEIQRGYRVL